MDFASDENVKNIGDEFMFGPSILVCPVYEYQARSREVYLPAGQGWYDFYTGKYYEGGQKIVADAPYERLPLFVKEGSVIPVGPEVEFAMQSNNDALVLWIYGGKNAEFELYEDDNINYDYEKGDFGLLKFTYDEQAKSVKIDKQQGTFNSMPKERTIGIIRVSKEKPVGFSAIQAETAFDYTGEELSTELK